MAENVYEGMFILDANRYAQDPQGVSGQIPKMIQDAGGEVLVSRLWEERRLAFPIKGHRKGAYWLTYFRVDGTKIAELERTSHLSNTILRVLFLKVEPRIVDALVEHARSGQIGSRTTETSEESPEAPKASEETKDEAATTTE